MLTNTMDVERIGDQDQGVVYACFEVVTKVSHLPNDLLGYETIINKLVASEPLLSKIYLKSQKRSLMDKKVAPGSDAVKRSILNARYCLCLLNINLGKHYELQSTTYDLAITYYQRALIWYPHSVEAGHLLGQCLRSRAVTVEKLDFVQFLWERALAAMQVLERGLSSPHKTESDVSIPLAQPEKNVLDLLLMREPSTETGHSFTCESLDPSTLAISVNRVQATILYREREAGKKVYDSLLLLYCQENQVDKALPLFLAQRYQWKLSQEVLTYEVPQDNSSESSNKRPCLDSSTRQLELESRADFPFTFGYDSILPDTYLRRLQHVFRPSSPFWSEHQYDFYSNCSRQVGYFSYIYNFREQAATNVIEQVIDIVYQTVVSQLEVGAATTDSGSDKKHACLEALRSEATTAEWWVHSRPHSSGHQFHFDSDETALYGGEHAQHPIASCIIYLSEGVGGPTIVTNQTLASSNLASYGYLMQPKENRLAMFDATFLHGVVPGRGLCPKDDDQAMDTVNMKVDGEGVVPRRRLSFMVGFWKRIKAKDRGPGCPGPGQPFPVTRSQQNELNHHYTWPEEMTDMLPPQPPLPPASTPCSRRVFPRLIEPIWEPVCRQQGDPGSVQEDICAQYSTCFQGF